MSALDRWRERCRKHVASSRWLPWRRRNVPGIEKALDWSSVCGTPRAALFAISLGGVFYAPDWTPGLRLALRWLREEIVRGE